MEMMERNKKLRLLVTTNCPNKCPLCCNNSWDFSKLPNVEHFDYEEIMITGGEPLLYDSKVRHLSDALHTICPILYPDSKMPMIYIYTSIACYESIFSIIYSVDGIVLTPHDKKAADDFIHLNDLLLKHPGLCSGCSMRLNLFKDIKAMLPEDIDLSLWKVKDMEWIKNCPVPEGEDFRRLPELWTRP